MKSLAFVMYCTFALMQTASAQFLELPAAGFAVSDGTSAYVLCNAVSNFGNAATKDKHDTNDQCAVSAVNEIASPLPGFKYLVSNLQKIVMNNAFTDGKDVAIGNLTEHVWRNAEKTECIYGVRLVAVLGKSADYNVTSPGIQYFRINDISRGGFAGLPIAVAYAITTAVAKPLYRVGRTFTSVQYQGNRAGPAPGYLMQPLISPAYSRAINGINDESQAVPTAAQQSASLDDNWVTFTTFATASNDSGKTSAASGMFYVKAACTAEPPEVVPDAIRLRQTVMPFIEVSVPGFVPPGGKVTPAATVPF